MGSQKHSSIAAQETFFLRVHNSAVVGVKMSSRYSSAAGGSRYPSAYGHTPSYRSYVKGDIGVDASYPSALGSSGLGSGSRSAALTDFDMNMPLSSSSLGSGLGSGLTGTGGSSSSMSSSRQVQQSSSSYSSNSADGGRPKVEFNKDSTYRSTATGPSGVPHSSYAHSSQNYNSDNPYGNRTSNYSYNI